MAKKKYRIKVFDMEVTSTDINELIHLQSMLDMCAKYERILKHLSLCEIYEEAAKKIGDQIGEQV